MRIPIDWRVIEISDTRANRLVSCEVVAVQGGQARLYIYAHPATARQIETVFGPMGCRRVELTEAEALSWRFGFQLDGPPGTDGETFLELMKEVLTLIVPSELDAGIALEFYKDPNSNDDPKLWAETPTGALIKRGKYAGFAKEGQELAAQLASVVDRHPSYRVADAIVMVPSSHNKFGERLAEAVAKQTAKPFIRTHAAHATRPEAKNATDEERFDLSGEFTIPEAEARGKVLIVVDDVYKTGSTMRAVAAAARTAGAISVLGLVGARTMRKGAG